jgi:hypothetical protein
VSHDSPNELLQGPMLDIIVEQTALCKRTPDKETTHSTWAPNKSKNISSSETDTEALHKSDHKSKAHHRVLGY